MPITIQGSTNARVGSVSPTMGGFSTAFDGTIADPADRAGSTNMTLGSFGLDFDGQFGTSASFDGAIDATMSGFDVTIRQEETALSTGDTLVVSNPGVGLKGGENANLALAFSDWTNGYAPVTSLSHLSAYGTGASHGNGPNAAHQIVSSGLPSGTTETNAIRVDQDDVVNNPLSANIRLRWGWKPTATTDDYFVCLNRYYDYSRTQIANMKIFRFYPPNQQLDVIITGGSGGSNPLVSLEDGGPARRRSTVDLPGSGSPPQQQWNNEQVKFRQSSVPGSTRDGFIEWEYNNVMAHARDDVFDFGGSFQADDLPYFISQTGGYDEFYTMQTEANEPDWNDGPNYVYWTAWYMDNTFKNVMIGNSATWANCNIREVQPPTAWDADDITVQFRKGRLSSGTNYIFVSDVDGIYQSAGTVEVS